MDAEILDGFEGRTDGCGSELGLGSGAGVKEEMGVGCGVLLGFWRVSGVKVGDDDALADVGVGDFTEEGGLGGVGDMEAGDAAVEPEASGGGEVGVGFGLEVDEDADAVAASLVDEVIEIVKSAEGWVNGLGIWSGVCEQDGVDAQ